MDNQDTSTIRAELEEEAAAILGEPSGQPSQEVEQTESTTEATSEVSEESASEESGTEAVTTEAQPEFILADEEKAFVEEMRKLTNVDGTPFKTVPALKDGYKNLQSQWTKTQERIKQHEEFLSRIESDEQYRAYIEQAQQLFDNPTLQRAYAEKYMPGDPEPDPRQYDINDPEQYAQFKTAHSAWQQRQVNSVIDSRFGAIEEKNRLERARGEFQAKHPDVENPESLLMWLKKQGPQFNPYEFAYRVREFDNIRAQSEAEARAKLTKGIEEAGTTKTPVGGAPPVKKVGVDDILKAIDTLHLEGAIKKYGKDKVQDALRKDAERLMET